MNFVYIDLFADKGRYKISFPVMIYIYNNNGCKREMFFGNYTLNMLEDGHKFAIWYYANYNAISSSIINDNDTWTVSTEMYT